MKLIDTWHDKYYNLHTNIYILKNGMRVVHTINPSSVEVDVGFVLSGGSVYENQIGVPSGTAHLYEHILFNGNAVFKNKEALDSFSYGTKSKPAFWHNGSTSKRYLGLYGGGNYKAALRLIKLIISQIKYPESRIHEFIEKERKIVLDELQREKPEEKNQSIQYDKFFFNDTYPEFVGNVIGSKESILSITIDDLIKYKNRVLTGPNSVFTIVTSKTLTTPIKKAILELENILPKKQSSLKRNKSKIKPRFQYKHFFDDSASNGIFLSVAYLYTKDWMKIDYKSDRATFFIWDLFRRSFHLYLREKNQVIYDLEIINQSYFFDYKLRGINFTVDKDKLLSALDFTFDAFESYWKEFLFSKEGERWFESEVSGYIFKVNSSIKNNDYAYNIGCDLLEDSLIKFDYSIAKEEAIKLTREDLVDFYKEFFKNQRPRFWFESRYQDEEVLSIFKRSKFYKKFH